MVLCEHVMEVAETEAKKLLHATLVQTICKLSDEMIATAEEIDINEPRWRLNNVQKGIHTGKQVVQHIEDGTELARDDLNSVSEFSDDHLSA
jgi:hypothetical protein